MCGSFRREPEVLRETFSELVEHFEVLSPLGLDFVDPTADFVRLPHESRNTRTEIEQSHLDALVEADFVWLHAPEGYVGPSAMFELGHAKALGIPIFSDHAPDDETFAAWVTVVGSPREVVLEQTYLSPGNGIRALQRYYERAALRRGWANESPQDTLLLMTEEMGELARAIRKSAGLARDGDWEGQDVADELSDVQLYLVHLSNALGIDLADAVTAKEAVNAERVAARESVA
jgi:NTP pyrophosphatase (non-canonical NTP hydrolase)